MAFTFSGEQRALGDAVAAFLAEHGDESAVRALSETELGYDPAVWRVLAEQLGVVGLIVPECHGGSGAGLIELAVVCEEFGKTLFCGPYLSSAVLATSLLVEMGDDVINAALLPALAGGERTATVALDEGGGTWDPASVGTTATRTSDGWTVSGTKRFVLDGASADVLLVVAAGPRVFAVDRTAPGVTVTPLQTLDRTRRQADITFAAAPARPLDGDAAVALRRSLDIGMVMLAAEQAGGARRALDMAVHYARQRYQFGRAIGSFQAVKHMCADLLVETESAYSAAYYAAWALAGKGADTDAVGSVNLAAAFCADAFLKVAGDNIQIHGGIGFTWEHPAHLYLRRARSGAKLFGDSSYHRDRYLADILRAAS
ncbi:acyl-CoA dehydrogenase family protein [Mycolicibacterium thermoresistibile]